MSPNIFHNDHHAKPFTNNNGSSLPPCLKVSKESHISKHASSSSSSSLSPSSVLARMEPSPQRHQPVIIYTHAPKIIHTHPKDFMALVQKLTGLSRTEEDDRPNNHKQEKPSVVESIKGEKSNKINDNNESSSVITEENSGNSNSNNINNNMSGDGQVNLNSCFVPPNPYMPADFLCSNYHRQVFGYNETLLFGSSIPSASSLEGISDFREF